MAFHWKDKKDIWKGEGIYFVTFSVAGRQKLLGRLVRILEDGRYAPVSPTDQVEPSLLWGRWDFERFGVHRATVHKSPLGYAIANDLQNIQKRHPGYEVCGKMIMENHLHVVIWVHDDGGISIKQWAHRFRIGVTQMAREMGAWPVSPVADVVHDMHSEMNGKNVAPRTPQADDDGHAGGLLLEKAFIRTLAHKGQLNNMLRYTHYNPDNLLLMRDHPDMYVIRRSVMHAGLRFDSMGKARLLDYPDRNVVSLSRSLTDEQIEEAVRKALFLAERGAVTYCAAMNAGEKAVSRAIREAGFPLVVMLLDGFPPKGSESARFYHPDGVYHNACGEGLLYLMAPLKETYEDPRLIADTDATLKRKDEEKGYIYRPLPHDRKRWRMIAGNMMLKRIAEMC